MSAVVPMVLTCCNSDETTLLSVMRERFPKGLSNSLPLFNVALLAISASSAAVIATIVCANGADGIALPMFIGAAAGAICLVSAFRAGGAGNVNSAYAQGQLDTASFLKRLDARARASLYLRAAVICLVAAALACVISAAFPGRIFQAPITAALLAVVLLRFAGVACCRTGGGWFFDALVPDEVVLDMTASADAWTRFRVGWILSGRVTALRRAAALRSDLPQEVRQIVLAQYSPQAIFVPVLLVPKSVGSELRLMLAGGRVGGAAMGLAAVLALAAVMLLPRDFLRIPALNELELPGLQSPPDKSPKDPDTPAGGQGQGGNDVAAGSSGASGGTSWAQGVRDGDSSAGHDGGGPTSGEGDGDQGQGGQSPAAADQQSQAGEGGAQDGKDAAQQGGRGASDAAGGAAGENSEANEGGPVQEPGAGPASGKDGSAGEALGGQDGQSPVGADEQGQAGEGATQDGKDSAQQAEQAGQAASDAASGADHGKSGAGEDGAGQASGDGQAADARDGGSKSQAAGGAKAVPDSTAGEGSGPESSRSGDAAQTQGAQTGSDPGGAERAGAGPDASSADSPVPVDPRRDGESRADALSDGVPADEAAGEASGVMREYVDELAEESRIIQTGGPADEADQELRISSPLADGTPEAPPEAAQPPQADVGLELKAGGPAALFAEKGEVSTAVEARLLPDGPVLPPSQAMPGEARQILPAWIDELMK